jgi:hypothetical protein
LSAVQAGWQVHALVENTDHIDDAFAGDAVEQKMRADAELAVTGPDLLAERPFFWPKASASQAARMSKM